MTRPICSTGTKIRSPAGERQLEVVALLPCPAAPEHLLVARDAVIDVDDEVARRQPLEDVARHDPPKRLGPADADGAEQLAVGDEREAVRPADEPAVEAPADERDRPRRWRLLDPLHDRDGVAGLLEDLREPRRLVGGEDDAAAVRLASRRPPRRGVSSRPSGSTGSRQPNRSPELLAARRHRAVRRRLRLPGQLEGPRRRPAGASSRAAGDRSTASPSAARRPRPARPAARRPGATGTRRPRRGRRARRARAACPGRCGRAPVAGASWAAQTSAASPTAIARDAPAAAGRSGSSAAPSNRARSAPSRSPRRAAALPRRSRIAATPPVGSRNSDAGRRTARSTFAGRPLVGRVERAQRVDLVAEELDPDRQVHRRREHVDDAAAPRELAAAGDLRHGRVAEIEQVAQQRVLVEPGADPQLPRLGRQVVGRDRVLEQRLDAGDQHAAPGRCATRPARRRGRRSRPPRARCARRRGRCAARARRPPPHRRATPPAPRPRGRRSPRRGRSRRAARSVASAAARYDLAPCGTATSPAWRPTRPMSGGRARAARAARRTCRSRRAAAAGPRGRAVGGPRRSGAPTRPWRRGPLRLLRGRRPGGPPRVGRHRPRRRRRRCRNRRRPRPSAADAGPRSPWRPPRRSGGRGRAGRAAAGSSIQASALSFLRWSTRRQPVFVRRTPFCVGGPVDLAGRREPVGVGLAELERVEPVRGLARAVAGPRLDRVGGGVEQLVEALHLVGRELREDVVAPVADRIADAHPEPAELLGLQLVDDRAQAVVAAVAARLAEPELAEGQREVVGDDEDVAERGVLAGQDLAHRQARFVHVGQRLDEGQVEARGSARRPRSSCRAGAHGRPSPPARRAGP